jgi:hypothetical protein
MLLVSLRSFLRRQGLPGTGPRYSYAETVPPLFARKAPWWINWAYGLLAVDVLITYALYCHYHIILLTSYFSTSAIELTWNYWTAPVAKDKDDTKSKEEPQTITEYVLRTPWERVALCTGHLALGVAAASALLVARARNVRTFHILPPLPAPATKISPSPPVFAPPIKKGKGKRKTAIGQENLPDERRVFLQTSIDSGRVGLLWPISQCSFQQGRDESELIFRVNSEKGHWYIGINDKTLIDGTSTSTIKDARDTILRTWGKAPVVGKLAEEEKRRTTGGWKSGPAIDTKVTS